MSRVEHFKTLNLLFSKNQLLLLLFNYYNFNKTITRNLLKNTPFLNINYSKARFLLFFIFYENWDDT